ncbi:two-component system sensor histidine kinase VicK [Pontibacter ummariensis]|uniref:histidine kinase n=1 Tax=Pontibacter ummariensis TaxID=1610492 RepID=A0A239KVA4_9BACT|nr:PAS domain-containing sensor histidine kinase [Pontibacter ummariensis]PRY05015.1 two-component system sensor histidine kinase VicK [Pontibacter ummariensis]SNT21154.1 two-component system, OmpR family, sensor histidine kinase VicK [Pontibacter ummariensis]
MDESSNYQVFEELIRQTGKVLFSYDVDSGSFTHLNTAFPYLWNRTRESVLANPSIILDTVHPDDRDYLVKEYRELLDGIIKYDVEFRIILPDKSVSWMLLNPKLVTDQQGKRLIAGIVEDITVAKDNIANLQKFAAKKNSILEILSHDLAGPIANIQGLAGLLSDYTREYENSQVDNVIRIIRDSSEKSIRMIRDFVEQEFLSSSNTGVIKRRVNLIEKVKEVMEQYGDGEDLIKKEFQFTSSSEKLYVNLDQNKFMQVINNLISNAIKFTRDNGVIVVDISEQEATVLITVKDNGIGIPDRYHDELFERFTPARREGLKGEPSTGLGMSIIKTIVEWHKGRIWFESAENEGTTFYIELPKE